MSSVAEQRQYLLDYIRTWCFRTGEFTLTSGKQSPYYIDLKPLMLSGKPLLGVVSLIIGETDRLRLSPRVIGGMAMGANFITAAVATAAARDGLLFKSGSIVYKETNDQGTTKFKVHNLQSPNTPVVLIDDVITTGKSLKEACNVFLQYKYLPLAMMAILDRQEGGTEMLTSNFGIPVVSLFKLDEVTSK